MKWAGVEITQEYIDAHLADSNWREEKQGVECMRQYKDGIIEYRLDIHGEDPQDGRTAAEIMAAWED